MDFRLELHIKPWKRQINLSEKVMLLGSCFTEHMAAKLSAHRFTVLENPHGILFNPVSICKALEDYAFKRVYSSNDLFQFNGLWQSWHHHGRFSSPEPEDCLKMINEELGAAAEFLVKADWLILTLGSAFIYELKPDSPYASGNELLPVANCHKVPAQSFVHRLLSFSEAMEVLSRIISIVRQINPDLNIVFTISPVRHYREGLVQNNRSKGLLHAALGEILEQQEGVHYFPAYELVMDDLRDYRFFAEDLVHPNYQATQYVWEKFVDACLDDASKVWLEKISKIQAALQHRPRQPNSEQHKAFLMKMYQETRQISAETPFIDWSDALDYFGAGAS